MADMASLLFKGTVDEIDVGKIAAGMDAEIQIGALPESKLAGGVDRIFPKAKKEGNATLFDIEIIHRQDDRGRSCGPAFRPPPSIRIRERKQVLDAARAAGPLRGRQALRRGPRGRRA